MKILNIKKEGEMIRVTTDYTPSPEFVYFIKKFNNKEELETEINKSIKDREIKKQEMQIKEDALLN